MGSSLADRERWIPRQKNWGYHWEAGWADAVDKARAEENPLGVHYRCQLWDLGAIWVCPCLGSDFGCLLPPWLVVCCVPGPPQELSWWNGLRERSGSLPERPGWRHFSSPDPVLTLSPLVQTLRRLLYGLWFICLWVSSHLEDSDPCLIWHLSCLLQQTTWEFKAL